MRWQKSRASISITRYAESILANRRFQFHFQTRNLPRWTNFERPPFATSFFFLQLFARKNAGQTCQGRFEFSLRNFNVGSKNKNLNIKYCFAFDEAYNF